MLALQMDLFEGPLSDVDLCNKKIDMILSQQDRQRKALFAKQHEIFKYLIKTLEQQQQEINMLKQALVKR